MRAPAGSRPPEPRLCCRRSGGRARAPRRLSARSITSSWSRLAAWIISVISASRPCLVFAGLPPFAAADASRTTVGRNRFPCSSKKCCATRVRTGLSLPTSSRSDPSSGRSWDETSANGSGRSPGDRSPLRHEVLNVRSSSAPPTARFHTRIGAWSEHNKSSYTGVGRASRGPTAVGALATPSARGNRPRQTRPCRACSFMIGVF